MLLAAIICFPLSSAAEEYTLTPVGSTVIQADGTTAQNADVVLYGQDLHCSYAKISGGAFTNALSDYEGTPVVITKFDASEILNGKQLKKATLKFDAKCTVSGKNSNVQIASIGTNWDAATATWNNTNTGEILNAVNLNGDGVNVKTSTVTLEQDVTEILSADEDKVIGFGIYTKTGRDQAISNIQLTIEAIDASASSTYTVKYVDGNGQELKASDKRSESIGAIPSITDDDKAAIYNADNTAKYIYVSDDAEGKTVASDGSTVITVTFREAAIWNYTINAVDGEGNLLKVLKTGTNFEAETFDVAYSAYINVDGTLYTSSKLSSDKKGYYFSLTLDADNTTKDVTFTASDVTNIVYFSEAEDIEGLTLSNNANTFVRSSNGASAYAAEDVAFTSLPNGKYKITTVICDATKNAGSVWNFKAGENNVFEFTASTVNWSEGTSEEFELNAASTDIILVKNGGNTQGVDLIYIVKTGDAELVAPTPAAGKMDFNAMEIATSSSSSTDGDITEDKTLNADDYSVTISPKASGNTNNRFWSSNDGPQLRIYNGTITIKAAAGKILNKIVFDEVNNGTMTADLETFDADTKTWTGEAETVIFTVSKQCRINSISVGDVPVEEPVANSIAELKTMETGVETKLMLNDAIVTAWAGKLGQTYSYMQDATGGIKVDMSISNNILTGQGVALNGYIYAKTSADEMGFYTLELSDNTNGDNLTQTEAPVTATTAAISAINETPAEFAGIYLKLENVTYAAIDPSDASAGGTLTDAEGNTITLYDQFGIFGFIGIPESTTGFKSISGYVSHYLGTLEFHPYGEYEAEGGASVVQVSSIAEMKALPGGTDVELTLTEAKVTVAEQSGMGMTIVIEDATGGVQVAATSGYGELAEATILSSIFSEAGQIVSGTIYCTYLDFDQAGGRIITDNANTKNSHPQITTGEIAPTEATVAEVQDDAYDWRYVKVSGVKFNGDEGTFVQGESSILMSDMFGKMPTDINTESDYDVTGLIMQYPTYDDSYENIIGYMYFLLPLKVVEATPVRTHDYAVAVGETHNDGDKITSVTDIVMTYGGDGGGDNLAAYTGKADDSHIAGYTASVGGNGVNPVDADGKSFDKSGNVPTRGTYYMFEPKYDGTLSVGVILNANKKFYIVEDGTALDAYNGITVDEKYYGTYEFDVKGGKTYHVFCTGSKLGFYGFDYTSKGITEAIKSVNSNVNVLNGDVYSVNGVKVRNAGESLEGLAKGLYIIGGKKVVVK